MDDDEVIEFSVEDVRYLAQAPQKVRDACPVTFAVRAQLVEMIDEGTFEEFEALALSVITIVYNLESKLVHMRADLMEARADLMEARVKAVQTATCAKQLYTAILDLETRLLDCGVPLPRSQYGLPDFPDV